MNTKIISLFALIWTVQMISTSGPLLGQEEFTIDEAIQYALDHRNEVKNAYLDIKDAEAQIKEIRAIGMPKLTAGANYRYNIELPVSIIPSFGPEQGFALFPDADGQQRLVSYIVTDDSGQPVPGGPQELRFGTKHNVNGSIDFNMLLFEGSYIVGLQTAALYKNLAALQERSTSYDVKEAVTNAFYTLLIDYEILEIFDRNIENIQQLYDETKITYEEGFIEQLDVDRFAYTLASLEIQKKNYLKVFEVNKNLLKFNMGYPMADDINVNGDIEQIAYEFVVSELMTPDQFDFMMRPDYAVAKKGLQLNDQDIKRYKYQRYPTVSLFGNYSGAMQGDKFSDLQVFPSSLVGASLSVPIYDGGDKKYKIERAKIAKWKTENQINLLEESIRLELQNIAEQLELSKQNLALAKENLELAEKIYTTAQIKYKEGVGSSVELRQSQGDLFGAQQELISALYDIITVRNSYLKATGQL